VFFIVLDWILFTHLAKHGGLDPLATGFELFCATWHLEKFKESQINLKVVLFVSKCSIYYFYFDQGLF